MATALLEHTLRCFTLPFSGRGEAPARGTGLERRKRCWGLYWTGWTAVGGLYWTGWTGGGAAILDGVD